MNHVPDNLSKLLGILFLGNLLIIGFVIILSVTKGIPFYQLGLPLVAVCCFAVFPMMLRWSFLRHQNADDSRTILPLGETPTREPRLYSYLANSLIVAAGLSAFLALPLGLLNFYAELGQNFEKDLVILYDWLVQLLTLVAAMAAMVAFFGFLYWMLKQDAWRANQINQRLRDQHLQQRRRLARERAEKNRIAQLHKPDFRVRLSRYISNVEPNGDGAEQPFVSKVRFWQRELVYERTLPKPIELIRRILQRISNAVHGTSN